MSFDGEDIELLFKELRESSDKLNKLKMKYDFVLKHLIPCRYCIHDETKHMCTVNDCASGKDTWISEAVAEQD